MGYTKQAQIVIFLFISTSIFFWGCSVSQTGDKDTDDPLALMTRVFDYEIQNFSTNPSSGTWINSTFFMGSMAAYNKTGNQEFLKETYKWAQSNGWKTGSREFHADDQAVGQVYVDLYKIFQEDDIIDKFQTEAEKMIAEKPDMLLWWWADALFMAPPGLINLALLTDQKELLAYTHQEWEKAFTHLYNKSDSLFYRDKALNNHINEEEQKVYWLRGNGWVIAGLAKILHSLNSDSVHYERYRTIYMQMIDRLVSLQSENGLWHPDLLRKDKYPIPDTSGSALICYSLGWGINNKLLIDEEYTSAFMSCWNGLKDKVDANGELRSVQPVGHKPVHFSADNSEVFGSGAFLLAASEVYLYQQNH